MKFFDILILGVVLGGGYTYFVSKEKPPTTNQKLITQFDKHDVIKRSDWEKGDLIDGIQVYTVRKDYTVYQSIWSLGKDDAGVIVLTPGRTPAFEAAFALSQCSRLAKAVVNSDASTIADDVSSIFKNAITADKDKNGVLRATSLYINLCNCLILICSIQHQKQVNLWTKNSCRLWLTNWPKISKPLTISASSIAC
ncbi:hypothetical protein DCF38_08890 [Edwardsiella piscicida]|uniref:hypothetical protein n=1 Tax=Edwardsiella piscicida TaxID=1263550 RepID=UPI001A9C38F7|nr:hypothetical protein [Edwardsiella piscicida]UCQ39656.1 hypothetical protein DCF38_08890 [Edwardsiella piscicida]